VLPVAPGVTTVPDIPSTAAPPEDRMPETIETDVQTQAAGTADTLVEEPLVEESLVEEVSIDGMCGVY
jgi:mycofactocin precursor